MLAGRLPFTGNPMVMLSRHLAASPPFEQLAGLPPILVELLTGLMEKDPAERRPQSAAELRGMLDETLRGLALGGTTSVSSAASGENAQVASGGRHGGRPSEPMPTTSVIEPGTVLLDRYRLGREIGHGDGGRPPNYSHAGSDPGRPGGRAELPQRGGCGDGVDPPGQLHDGQPEQRRGAL